MVVLHHERNAAELECVVKERAEVENVPKELELRYGRGPLNMKFPPSRTSPQSHRAGLDHHNTTSDTNMSDEDTYEIPLQDQRVFGAGIKRQRVKFVPSTESSATVQASGNTPTRSVGDFYLSLVLKDSKAAAQQTSPAASITADPLSRPTAEVCEICNLPFQTHDTPEVSNPRPHEASLAHQICLTHSHPPSHLDRNRKGLAYLTSYGWDPDSRMGLGASGQGIQYPIKTKPKDDKMGIGVLLPKESERKKKEKIEKLDAGKVRKMHEKDKKRAEKLREMFYRNDDVERYLGGG